MSIVWNVRTVSGGGHALDIQNSKTSFRRSLHRNGEVFMMKWVEVLAIRVYLVVDV